MRYVKLRNDINWPDKMVPAGTVIGVEEDRDAEIVFILTGELSNRSIHTSHIVDVDMLELLEQSRADELLATRNADRMTDELLIARSARDRLIKNVAQLKRELDESSEAKKVSLPRAVAEALDLVRSNAFHDTPEAIVRIHARDRYSWASEVQVLNSVRLDTVIRALYFGYTIEETMEDSARDEIRRWYKQFCEKAPHGADEELAWAREGIEEIVHYLGGDAIIADISPWNQTQLKKKQPANG